MNMNGNGFGGGQGNPMNMRHMANMSDQLRKSFGPQFLKNIMNQLPVNELQTLQNNPDWGQWFGGQLFGGGADGPSGDHPRIDVYQTRNEVVAVVEVPGLESSGDVNVNIKSDTLTVSGSLVGRFGSIAQDRFSQSERFRGDFNRTVSLPVRVKPQQARATYRNSLLEIRITKDQRQTPGGKSFSVPINFT
ncbi:MAG: Hsp20/alpha crystallin family protein [Tumebacillaceae bacterium]